MKPNLIIVARERGKISEIRQMHNVWLDSGRAWLASMLALTSQDPDVPEETVRPKSMGFGIGGIRQTDLVADAAPFTTYYPAGSDPQATDGHKYDDQNPLAPPVTCLERPVRFSGGSTTYPGASSDVWRIEAEYYTHPGTNELTLWFRVPAGSLAYSPFTPYVPISEIGLFHSGEAITDTPFSTKILAYRAFNNLKVGNDVSLEVAWTIGM